MSDPRDQSYAATQWNAHDASRAARQERRENDAREWQQNAGNSLRSASDGPIFRSNEMIPDRPQPVLHFGNETAPIAPSQAHPDVLAQALRATAGADYQPTPVNAAHENKAPSSAPVMSEAMQKSRETFL